MTDKPKEGDHGHTTLEEIFQTLKKAENIRAVYEEYKDMANDVCLNYKMEDPIIQDLWKAIKLDLGIKK